MAVYKDIPLTEDKDSVLDAESVFQAVNNILSTKKGERLFLPEFGSLLEELLFEPIDDDTAFLIKTELIRAIEEWDPRVQIDYNETQIIPYPDENRYEVTLVFSIIGLDDEKFEMVKELRK